MIQSYKTLSTLFFISSLSVVVFSQTTNSYANDENAATKENWYKDLPWVHSEGSFDKLFPYPPYLPDAKAKNEALHKILDASLPDTPHKLLGNFRLMISGLSLTEEEIAKKQKECEAELASIVDGDDIKFLEPITITQQFYDNAEFEKLQNMCPRLIINEVPFPHNIRKLPGGYNGFIMGGTDDYEYFKTRRGYPKYGTANFMLYKVQPTPSGANYVVSLNRIYPNDAYHKMMLHPNANKDIYAPGYSTIYRFIRAKDCWQTGSRSTGGAFDIRTSKPTRASINGLVQTLNGIRVFNLTTWSSVKISLINPELEEKTNACVFTHSK